MANHLENQEKAVASAASTEGTPTDQNVEQGSTKRPENGSKPAEAKGENPEAKLAEPKPEKATTSRLRTGAAEVRHGETRGDGPRGERPPVRPRSRRGRTTSVATKALGTKAAQALSSRHQRASPLQAKVPEAKATENDGAPPQDGKRLRHSIGNTGQQKNGTPTLDLGRVEGHEHPKAQPDCERSGRSGRRGSAQAGVDFQDPANPGGEKRPHFFGRRP